MDLDGGLCEGLDANSFAGCYLDNIRRVLDSSNQDDLKMALIVNYISSYVAKEGHVMVVKMFNHSMDIASCVHFGSTKKCKCASRLCVNVNMSGDLDVVVNLHDKTTVILEIPVLSESDGVIEK